ncbi:hypothetical protein SAMD00019534_029000 [Acytostelium subglobosum LB1]|uniref:hypothetical protein n=1 Tax=Acytostelium subglobosum LB1 TaxID=1410327 RepID=UPI0006449209|nr:hypothetical protein SAMD00019534_029000 [Acytostelium subglobosum LB1]GAM19725.1 hypothetical protein SAMD00019534_029000 [Acytostelium subglobosum LB1]|eukprot:XP_012756487.1 hypothetical protein SAMD00019534_029000 [Acytostelium subglobosum LB1]
MSKRLDDKNLQRRVRFGYADTCNFTSDTSSAMLCTSYSKGMLATGSSDKIVNLWDCETHKSVMSFAEHTNGITSVSLDTDDNTVVSASWDKTAKVWDTRSGKCVRTLKGHSNGVRSVVRGSNPGTVITGSADKSILVWDIATSRIKQVLKGHTSGIHKLVMNRSHLLSSSGDSAIRMWNLEKGETIKAWNAHEHDIFCLHSYSSIVATSAADRRTKVWDLSSGGCLYTIQHQDVVGSLKIGNEGKFLMVGQGNGDIGIYNLKDGSLLRLLRGHSEIINGIELWENGLITCSSDKSIKLWSFCE